MSETLSLDLRRLQVTTGYDANDQPTIVLSDGDHELVLGGGEDKEVLAGARRIVSGIWDYQLLVAARQEAAYRLARLERQHGIERPAVIAGRYSSEVPRQDH